MTINLPLSDQYQDVVQNMDAEAVARLAEKVRSELDKQRLIQTMKRIGEEAKRRGMTQEVLEELLKEIS